MRCNLICSPHFVELFKSKKNDLKQSKLWVNCCAYDYNDQKTKKKKKKKSQLKGCGSIPTFLDFQGVHQNYLNTT